MKKFEVVGDDKKLYEFSFLTQDKQTTVEISTSKSFAHLRQVVNGMVLWGHLDPAYIPANVINYIGKIAKNLVFS